MDFSNHEVNIKEIYKQLRKDIIEGAAIGGHNQRIRLLMYGFLRNKPYESLESKTQGDTYCSVGQRTYYDSLCWSMARQLRQRFELDYAPSIWDTEEYKAIDAWMRKRWSVQKEEAA